MSSPETWYHKFSLLGFSKSSQLANLGAKIICIMYSLGAVEQLIPEEWISVGFQLSDIFSNLLTKNHPFLNKSTWGCCRTTNRCPAPVLLCGWVPELIVLSTAKGTGRKKTLWVKFANIIQKCQLFLFHIVCTGPYLCTSYPKRDLLIINWCRAKWRNFRLTTKNPE